MSRKPIGEDNSAGQKVGENPGNGAFSKKLRVISMRSAAFTRERSKVRSLVRPPEPSIKSDTFSKARSGVHFPVHSVCGWSHDVAQNRSGSNSKKPNRNDGTKHGQAGNRPARHVNRTVGLRCVHHRVMPMGHISLLKA